jgi:biotin carboxylase
MIEKTGSISLALATTAILGQPPRVLLIAPHGSYRTAPFIDTAVRHAIDLLVASEGRHSLVGAYAEGLHVDFDDPDAALEIITQEAIAKPFGGIIATDDATTELACSVAQRLGLPCNDPAAVRIARRKDLARNALAQAGVPVPAFRTIGLERPLVPQLDGLTYPCVLKPLAMSASRGVIRVDSREELIQAALRVERIVAGEPSPDERRRLLVETFIPGFEVAVEGLLTAGTLEVLTIFDKPDPLDGPYFEETYYITPSRLDPVTQAEIRGGVETACRAYGLREGPVHAECRINRDGIWILELAARTIGGLCSRLFRFGVGYSLEELVLFHAIGTPRKPVADPGAAGVLMIPISKAGVLRRVEGVQAATEVPYIREVVIQVREGYELVPLPEGSSYLGFIFCRAPDSQSAEAALRRAYAELNVVIAPRWRCSEHP